MRRLRITPRASQDLIEIWNHIADDGVEIADRFIDELDETMRKISRHPGIGRERQELAPRIRSFPHQHYVIFCRVRSNCIEIVRVLHGARDVDESFETDGSENGSES